MKLLTPFALLCLSGGLSYASSLAVYQDSSVYAFTPTSPFIGFTQEAQAQCEGTVLPLVSKSECPKEERLCQLLGALKQSEEALQTVRANNQTLTQMLSLARPENIDASQWITAAKTLSQEQSKLSSEEKILSQDLLNQQNAFESQAPSLVPQELTQSCAKAVELHLPYGAIGFSTEYEANLENEKEITVTQRLLVTNRSGVDIKADKALFYYRSATQTVYPTHFNPWVVRKYEPRPKAVAYDQPMAAEVMAAPMAVQARSNNAKMATPPVARYEDAREYSVDALDLPSSGSALSVPVLSWKAPVSCEIRAYPYENPKAFEVCSFVPKHQIDANEWKVKSAQTLINAHALGEYQKESYDLYTKVVEDIQIERKPMVDKEGEGGLFGGNIRKNDGFTLTLINKSDKPKTLKLIERIPSSSTHEIKSKLLSITSEGKIDYKLLDDGQIEINSVLAAQEHKKIEVLFELEYDKELKVGY